jgi:uncharacterized OsmC-like protein
MLSTTFLFQQAQSILLGGLMMDINGVDVDALKVGLDQVRKDPSLGQYVFRATTVWAGGARSASRIRDFTLEADESKTLFGSNQAPNPVEQVLAALGGCLTIGISYVAALKGIGVDSIAIETEGDLDIRGFFGVEGVHPGYQRIQVLVHLQCDAGREETQTLLDSVVKTSPVIDILMRGIPVSVRLAE